MHAITSDRPGVPHRAVRTPDRGEAPRAIRLARGQTLFFEGDEADAFFDIVSGTVRCCRLISDGRRQIHRFAAAGAMVGVGCIGTYGYTAEAVTEVVARRHRLAGLDTAMAEPNLRGRVLQALREELAATRTHMTLLGQMSAAERLATFLLRLPDDRGGDIELPMTRSDIADYLGLTVETVSRKLHELEDLGFIELVSARRIRITDLNCVEAISEAA